MEPYDAIYVQSIKALNNKIENLEIKNKTLKKENVDLYVRLKKIENWMESTQNTN